MLSFRHFRLITENVVDSVKKKYERKSHPYAPAHKLLDAIFMDDSMYSKVPKPTGNPLPNHNERINAAIDHLTTGDPSKDKKHLPQITHWYSNRDFRAEDLGSKESHDEHPNHDTVYGTLKAFSDPKNSHLLPDIEHPDPHKAKAGQKLKGTRLSSYEHMTFGRFRAHVHKHLGLEGASSLEQLHNHPDVVPLGEHDGTKLYHLTSEAGAKHAAKCAAAKWCTGWEKDNQFHQYKHNLFVAHHSDGTVHQIHAGSQQFMDKDDEEVDEKQAAKDYPGLTKFHQLHNYVTHEGDMPLTPDDRKEDEIDHALRKLEKFPSYETFRGSHIERAITKHGNERQLDEFIHKTSSRRPYRTIRCAAAVRKLVDFKKDPHAYQGEKGTVDHLASIFARQHRAEDLEKSMDPHDSFQRQFRDKIVEYQHRLNNERMDHFPINHTRPLHFALTDAFVRHMEKTGQDLTTRLNHDPVERGRLKDSDYNKLAVASIELNNEKRKRLWGR